MVLARYKRLTDTMNPAPNPYAVGARDKLCTIRVTWLADVPDTGGWTPPRSRVFLYLPVVRQRSSRSQFYFVPGAAEDGSKMKLNPVTCSQPVLWV
jgi:hypothetical protein